MRPNFLIIMSDDQGPWALGCAGTPELETPTLDHLADEGMRFKNFFCVSPVCSPARASFLTGCIPSSHGVHDWIRSGNFKIEGGVMRLGKDRPVGYGEPDHPTEYLEGVKGFTDYLVQDDYVCGLSGKWHLGDSGKPQKGHDFWCTHYKGGDSYNDYFIFDNSRNMTHQTQYVTDLFTDRALNFLDQYGNGENPFCLSVHYTSPHTPWKREEQPEEIWSIYEKRQFSSLPVLAPHPWGGWNPTPQQRKESIEGYFTTITAMDRNIGRLLSKLDEIGVTDNTVVLFTSDNGYNLGHHGTLGKGNGTFPLNMFEESVKVPFIARFPGTIPGGVVNGDLVSHYDVLPTVLEMAGIKFSTGSSPGRSFTSSLKGDPGGSDVVVVCDEYGPVRMIRERRWKYIHRYPYGLHELYDLEQDPSEVTNLIDNTEVRGELKRLRGNLTDWFGMFVDSAQDGARLPVTGRGQINFGDRRNSGRCAFRPRQ